MFLGKVQHGLSKSFGMLNQGSTISTEIPRSTLALGPLQPIASTAREAQETQAAPDCRWASWHAAPRIDV
jgi:hypothetical protein